MCKGVAEGDFVNSFVSSNDVAQWLHEISETKCDTATLRAMLNNDAEKESKVDVEKHLREFHRRYQVLFEEARKENALRDERGELAEQNSTKRNKKLRGLRKLILVAAVIAAFSGSVLTAQALGYDIFGSIARWTSEVFSLGSSAGEIEMASFKTVPDGGPSWTYETLEEALQAFGITEELAPAWIPARFIEGGAKEVYANNYNGICVGVDYISGSDVLSYVIYEKDGNESFIEKEGETPQSFYVGDQLVYCFQNGDIMNVLWENGDVVCHLCANITEDEMMHILQSIFTKEGY